MVSLDHRGRGGPRHWPGKGVGALRRLAWQSSALPSDKEAVSIFTAAMAGLNTRAGELQVSMQMQFVQ